MSALVTESSSGGIIRITLNNPARRNALSLAMLDALAAALARVETAAAARVVVLAGAGPAFCAGHDLGEMLGRDESEYQHLFTRCSQVMLAIRDLPAPVIARVHGPAVAAGCQLVAACDLAVASTGASFATPGVKIGLFCTTPMIPILRSIPDKAAREMLFTGRPITAERACALGLVNAAVPLEALDAAVDDLTSAILAGSPCAARLGKHALAQTAGLNERDAYAYAATIMTRNAMLPDAQEGMSAFLEKRAPAWSDL